MKLTYTKSFTDATAIFPPQAYDPSSLPDVDHDFIRDEDLAAFADALEAPENIGDDGDSASSVFITALNDWRPVHQRVRTRPGSRHKSTNRRRNGRGTDESREGVGYALLKWPLFLLVSTWIVMLSMWYLGTRLYVWFYEQFIAWRGPREKLRKRLQSTKTYEEWIRAAKALDEFLGNDEWKKIDEYAYYDSATIKRVKRQLSRARLRADAEERAEKQSGGPRAVDELRALLEGCVKANFAGIENPHLYSQTYYGTKNLVQKFVDELEESLSFVLQTTQLSIKDKRDLFKQAQPNFGRTALCLSGGATFAYYHFGVVKALIDNNLLPEVITGTSGGAVVAALVATRTDDELRQLLVPALAARITACHDDFRTWIRRLYRTGARFDSLDWARRCSWFCRGSTTFREAYERTGRVLNVTCVPSDPYSPTILCNMQTSPDCVIWSAVLASAAVPGILSPVVLMKKNGDGTLAPYSFGHKWKDGSLRTDIPLKPLELRLNVHFSIVSQVNPHVNLFVFSSRGQVGRPVTHRRGRGWRGGFLVSALEQYIKLDLNKWWKVLRHLELLPRPLGQDWSEVWLQRYSGNITIWPKSVLSDFWYILSDPTPTRLARMLRVGQHATFPKLKFISNRMKIERLLDEGRRATRSAEEGVLSHEDLQKLLEVAKSQPDSAGELLHAFDGMPASAIRPALGRRSSSSSLSLAQVPAYARNQGSPPQEQAPHSPTQRRPVPRRPSVMSELSRQSRVFFDDDDDEDDYNDDDWGRGDAEVDLRNYEADGNYQIAGKGKRRY